MTDKQPSVLSLNGFQNCLPGLLQQQSTFSLNTTQEENVLSFIQNTAKKTGHPVFVFDLEQENDALVEKIENSIHVPRAVLLFKNVQNASLRMLKMMGSFAQTRTVFGQKTAVGVCSIFVGKPMTPLSIEIKTPFKL